MKKLLILITLICFFTSCSNYYKAVLASNPATAGGIEDLKMNKRYFILRDSSKAFAMNNISFSADQKIMQCTLDSLPLYEHRLHLTKGNNGKMKYHNSKSTFEDESGVLNEVHIYVNNTGVTTTGTYILPVAQIQKIEILEKNKAKTKASHTLGLVLGIAVPLILVVVIAAAIVASTPIL